MGVKGSRNAHRSTLVLAWCLKKEESGHWRWVKAGFWPCKEYFFALYCDDPSFMNRRNTIKTPVWLQNSYWVCMQGANTKNKGSKNKTF
jgi:hypothetical protein